MRFSQEFLQQLLEQTDLVQWIQQKIELKKIGSRFQGLCPFHNEKTASFTVSPEKQFYHCFGCGAHGNIFDFLMHSEGHAFPQTVKMVAQAIGMPLPVDASDAKNDRQAIREKEFLDQFMKHCQEALWNPKNRAISDYLISNRGINKATLLRFNVGYFSDASQPEWHALLKQPQEMMRNYPIGWLRGRVTFPIRNRQGECVGFGGRTLGTCVPKYLNSKESDIFQKGKLLYGLYETLCNVQRPTAGSTHSMLLVEGYLDVMALAQHGCGPVAATLGTAVTLDQLKLAFRYAQQLMLCYDSDTAGQTAAWRAVMLALPLLSDNRQLKLVILPKGEDPASILKIGGLSAFEDCLKTAVPLSEYLFGKWLQNADLSSLEGKAQFCRQAWPHIQQIPQPEFRLQLEQRLAALVGILDPQVFTSLVKSQPPNDAIPQAIHKGPIRRFCLLVALLLHDPSLVFVLPKMDWDAYTHTVEVRLLRKLIAQAQRQTCARLSERIEVWRGKKIHAFLARQATLHLPDGREERRILFLDLFERFCKENLENKLSALLSQARKSALSLEEQLLCQRLLKSVKNFGRVEDTRSG